MVNQGRHTVVGIYAQELVCKLIALADVAFDQVVFKPTFLQLNGDFFAVRSRPIV
jgi:hypothetical protein